jgi:hypothetical protein
MMKQIAARQSAFDLLKAQFDEYGLGALVEPLRGLITRRYIPIRVCCEITSD